MPFFAATILGALALLAHTLWLGARGTSTTAPLSREEMRRFVLWRMFYVNPHDPRGWVPKPYGIGWTVNFRDRGQVNVFVALILFTIVSAIGQSIWAARVAASL